MKPPTILPPAPSAPRVALRAEMAEVAADLAAISGVEFRRGGPNACEVAEVAQVALEFRGHFTAVSPARFLAPRAAAGLNAGDPSTSRKQSAP
jgi:hypothetical protein